MRPYTLLPHRAAGFCIVAALLLSPFTGRALADNTPVGSTFTYQGRLTDGGQPADGTVDLVFRLFGTEAGGIPLPGGVLVVDKLELGEDGRFTVDLDFGDLFTGEPRWLEITVNDITLSPRQPIMAAPHAMVATTAASVPGKAMVGSYAGITGVGTLNELNVSGNVGIGTTNPLAQFHIDGAGTSQVPFHISSPGDSAGIFRIGSPLGHLGIVTNANNGDRRDIRFTDSGIALCVSETDSSPGTLDGLFVHESGRIGIGTGQPIRPLHVTGLVRFGETNDYAEFDGSQGVATIRRNDSTGPKLRFFNTSSSVSNSYGRIDFEAFNGIRATIGYIDPFIGPSGLQFSGSTDVHMKITDAGHIGVGTLDPAVRLHVATGTDTAPAGGGYLVLGNTTGTNVSIDSNEIMARDNGVATILHLNADGGQVRIGQNSSGTGLLQTPVLQITGGSDLSERFDVAVLGDLTPQPGMVVCIDPTNPGKLIPSTRAYDRTVAGVISGAGGVKTGMLMGQTGTEADGEHPVALSGRAYVMVDAAGGEIVPGDLLTTSNVPGHAMKAVDRDRRDGAIIGKAMTPLAAGERGLVLVLVNLH